MKPFFQLVSSQDFRTLLDSFPALEPETVPLMDGLDRFAAETIYSPEDLPPFPRSTMDGYAVRATDTFGCSESEPALLKITGEVVMGRPPGDVRLQQGRAAAIWTGGELPVNSDAVVMIEHTRRPDPGSVEIYRPVAPGENVIRRGEDLKQEQPVIQKGSRLRPQDLGLLAGLGVTEIPVHRKPVVGIISTGDELVPPDQTPGPGRIRDINTTTLSALTLSCGAIPLSFGIIEDKLDPMLAACTQAIDTPVDILLISGGSSVGKRDFTLSVFQALKGTDILAHGISIRPGKPTILARKGNCALFGVPGHVTSAMVVHHLFIRYLILRLSGSSRPSLPTVTALTGEQIPSVIGKEDFVRVKLLENLHAMPSAHPIYGKSGLLKSLVAADGLLRIDRDCEGLDKGETAEVYLLP